MAKFRTKLYTLYRRMTRLERAVLVLLCVFAVKFVCSTAAHFVPALQAVDMLGSGRNPVDIWLLLLSCTAVLGVFCLYRRAARAVGAKLTKADAVILGICIAASAAFYLHAMVGRQSLYLWDNATYYNLQVRLESNFADGVFTGVGDVLRHLALPAGVVCVSGLGELVKQTRSACLESLGEDYILTARAKGLGERAVMVRHAFRGALTPVLTTVLGHIPHIIGGSVVVEQVFGWPGMGSLLFWGIENRDYPVVMGVTVVIALAVLLTNLLLDLAYGLADPRVRYGRG